MYETKRRFFRTKDFFRLAATILAKGGFEHGTMGQSLLLWVNNCANRRWTVVTVADGGSGGSSGKTFAKTSAGKGLDQFQRMSASLPPYRTPPWILYATFARRIRTLLKLASPTENRITEALVGLSCRGRLRLAGVGCIATVLRLAFQLFFDRRAHSLVRLDTPKYLSTTYLLLFMTTTAREGVSSCMPGRRLATCPNSTKWVSWAMISGAY